MRARTILVVVVAALALTAMPAQAQNATAVASEHTTFGTGGAGEPSPTQTTNMTVQGSGESASVVYERNEIDTFEDGDVSDWESGSESFSAVQSPVYEGSFAGYLSSGGQVERSFTNETGTVTISYAFRTTDTQTFDNLALWDGDASDFAAVVGTENGEWIYYENSSPTSSGVSVSADTWYLVEIEVDLSADTYEVRVDGSAIATDIALNNPSAVQELGTIKLTGNSGNGVYVDRIAKGETLADSATYIGAEHDGEDIETGWANVSLSNADATVTWQEDADGDGSWTDVSSSTVSSSGNVTQDLSAVESDRWRVRIDVEAMGDSPSAEIHDEGQLFEPSSPTLSNPDPSGRISDYDGDISINVSDRDLGLAQGDTVVVEAEDGDGNQIGQQTVSSNGTVTFSYDALAGTNEITWTATDEYGTSDTLTQNFTTPAQLTVYRESENSTTITNATVTIRFYPVGGDEDQVVTRSTTDATINMSGLPGDQPFVAVANVSGYESRRIFIRSLFEQQRMFLLNDSVESAETIFQVRDYTGRFPPDNTVLEIRRSINGSLTTISGDYFGASAQYPATLELGARYRLRLHNPETGATRSLETYQPITAQTQTIEVSPDSDIEDLQRLPVATIHPQTRRVPALNDTQISTSLSQVENVSVDSWRVTVVRNSTTIINETYSGSTRQANITADLGESGGEQVRVSVVAMLDDGRTITAGEATLSVYESPTNNLSLLTLITDFVGLAAPGTAGALTSFLATAVTIFVMGGISTQLPVSGETTALAGVLTLTGFSVIGWVGYGVVFVAGSAVVAFAALRRGL